MRIYTKTGDTGETSLRLGQRLAKDAARVEAYGAVDECNCFIGQALALLGQVADADLARVHGELTRVQHRLFAVGGDLATPPDRSDKRKPQVSAAMVQELETGIDWMEEKLPPLKRFVLPGGDPAAAALHLARAVCRRAERRLVTLGKAEPVDPVLVQYLNRLSDYLFVAARFTNHVLGVPNPEVLFDG